MATPRIELEASGNPPLLRIQKSGDVPPTFWSRLRAELNANIDGDGTLTVPAERFLSNRSIVKTVCRTYKVGLSPDSRTRNLLQRRNREQQALQQSLQSSPRVQGDLNKRLQATRFTRQLYPFQERDLRKLLALEHGANFSVPGAGKTCVTYALYELERANDRVEKMLVVAPLSAFDAWEREAEESLNPAPIVERYSGSIDPNTEVLLTGYQRLLFNYETLAGWASQRNTHIILDEAHRMKAGRDGEWGKTCLDLAYSAERRDILTGTPAPHSPLDLESELDFLWPTQGPRLLPDDVRTTSPPPNAGPRIADRIRPLFVRTRKSELGLPDPEFQVLEVEPSDLQADIYDALCDRYSGQFQMSSSDRIDFAQMGEVVMYLLEAATNPSLLLAGSSRKDPETFRHPPLRPQKGSDLYQLLEQYAEYEIPAKFGQLGQLLKNNAHRGEKTLVWTHFVKNIHTLNRMLEDYEPALLYGEIPTDPSATRSRQKEIDRFRHDDDCMVMLANPAAASEGMSLHDVCHHAVYLDRTFNAGQYLQSVNRIHRLGLPDGVTTRITILQTAGTIDEVVQDRVSDKARRLSQMLEDPDIVDMELPSSNDFGPPVEEEDLQALFVHLRGVDEKG